jgi:hypothetical protein
MLKVVVEIVATHVVSVFMSNDECQHVVCTITELVRYRIETTVQCDQLACVIERSNTWSLTDKDSWLDMMCVRRNRYAVEDTHGPFGHL